MAASLALTMGAAAAPTGGRHYRNDALRIAELKVPRRCELAPPSPYPGVLLAAACAEGAPGEHGPSGAEEEARLLLAGQKVVPGSSALTIAAEARARLLKQGFAEPRVTPLPSGPLGEERVRIDTSVTGGGKKLLRQAYVVDNDVLIVLTMMIPAAVKASALQDFEDALASLTLQPLAPTPPLQPATQPVDGGSP